MLCAAYLYLSRTGCMIVQLLDYRPLKSKDALLEEPARSHVVLSPNGESLWQDICLLNRDLGSVWTDQETLELETRVLVSIILTSVIAVGLTNIRWRHLHPYALIPTLDWPE